MMHPVRPVVPAIRLTAMASLLTVAGALSAQTPLPATAPTAVTPSQLPSANSPVARGQAAVQWDGHLLQIKAGGESLNGVIAEIAARTSIHISGTAPEDRIYGTYGPAPLVDVLSELVSGLPVNMLFVAQTGKKPAELTFTARNGPATPPNPSMQQVDAPQQQQFSQQPPPQQQPPQTYSPPAAPPLAAQAPGSVPDASANGAPGSANGAPATDAAGSTPASPNGVKTPQEIFEQLQRLRANSSAPK